MGLGWAWAWGRVGGRLEQERWVVGTLTKNCLVACPKDTNYCCYYYDHWSHCCGAPSLTVGVMELLSWKASVMILCSARSM